MYKIIIEKKIIKDAAEMHNKVVLIILVEWNQSMINSVS